jgi:uncharacterized membrane protein
MADDESLVQLKNISYVVIHFDSKKGASDAVHVFKELSKEHYFRLDYTAVVTKDDGGELHVKTDDHVKDGEVEYHMSRGSESGTAYGLILGPLFFLGTGVGAFGGFLKGVKKAKERKLRVTQSALGKDLHEKLNSESESALAVIGKIKQGHRANVLRAITEQVNGKLLRCRLEPHLEELLEKALANELDLSTLVEDSQSSDSDTD